MTTRAFNDAVSASVATEMRVDPSIFCMSTWPPADLFEEFGPERVRLIPIAESAATGMALGAAACGMRPIVFLSNSTFSFVAFDQIVNQAAKIRYMSGGQCRVPVVFHARYSNGLRKAAQHAQTGYAMFAHAGGLKVAVPSNAVDGAALMRAAIRDDNPVMFVHSEMLATHTAVPDGPALDGLGQARTWRSGDDVTVVAIGMMVDTALRAAEQLAHDHVSVEVIDPRTLVPIDIETIKASVRRTGALAVVDESFPTCSLAAEVIAAVAECPLTFRALRAAPVRVCNLPAPMPFSPVLEDAVRPSVARLCVEISTNLLRT